MTKQIKKPTHRVCYSYKISDDQKERVTEIGAAWEHRSGFSLSIDVPITLRAGERLVMFENTEQN